MPDQITEQHCPVVRADGASPLICLSGAGPVRQRAKGERRIVQKRELHAGHSHGLIVTDGNAFIWGRVESTAALHLDEPSGRD
jgi:hypothetical protein